MADLDRLRKLTPEQQADIARLEKIFTGKYLETFKRLAEHPGNATPLRDLKVAKGDNLESDGNVRVRIAEINKKLKTFYRECSPELSPIWVAQIINAPTGGGYLLQFEPNKDFYLRRFWKPYLSNYATHITFTQLRFFRNNDRKFFFRHLDINDDTSDEIVERMAKREGALSVALNGKRTMKEAKASGVRETYFFTTTGEMLCVLGLTKLLDRYGVPNDCASQHGLGTGEASHQANANLILIGNIRTHPVIREFQKEQFYLQGWKWKIESRAVVSLNGDKKDDYEDNSVVDGIETVYALLSRMPSLGNQNVVTMIAANHGTAFRCVGDLLRNDDSLRSLLQGSLGLSDDAPLPDRFQIVFSVGIDKGDNNTTGATFVDKYVHTPAMSAPSRQHPSALPSGSRSKSSPNNKDTKRKRVLRKPKRRS